jgi:hypothetical protein
MKVSVNDEKRTRRTTYLVLGVVLLLLLGTALLFFRSARSTEQAEQKADQLIAALSAKGLRTPKKEQIVTILGDDGGAVCADPNAALSRSILYGQLTNGAAGPGTRPVIADNRALQGQLLIISIYCPDQLAAFAEWAADLKLAGVVKP